MVRAGAEGVALLASADTTGSDASLDRIVRRLARTDVSVLILGEPGSGKAFLAAQVHGRSARRSSPLVTLDGTRPSNITRTVAAAAGGALLVREPALLSGGAWTELSESLARQRVRVFTTSTTRLSAVQAQELATVTLAVPPLRARLRELPHISESILATLAAEHGASRRSSRRTRSLRSVVIRGPATCAS